jgi:hypothetical protein
LWSESRYPELDTITTSPSTPDTNVSFVKYLRQSTLRSEKSAYAGERTIRFLFDFLLGIVRHERGQALPTTLSLLNQDLPQAGSAMHACFGWIFIMQEIKSDELNRFEADSDARQCWARWLRRAAKALLGMSKSGSLAVSSGWITMDRITLIRSAPDQGTLVLGGFAVAHSFVLKQARSCLSSSIWPKWRAA